MVDLIDRGERQNHHQRSVDRKVPHHGLKLPLHLLDFFDGTLSSLRANNTLIMDESAKEQHPNLLPFLQQRLPELGLDEETYAPYVLGTTEDEEELTEVVQLLQASSESHAEEEEIWESLRKDIYKKMKLDKDYHEQKHQKELESQKAKLEDQLAQAKLEQQNAPEKEDNLER